MVKHFLKTLETPKINSYNADNEQKNQNEVYHGKEQKEK